MHTNASMNFPMLKTIYLALTLDPSKYKSWKVTGMLPWSALLFTVGFILRTVGAFGAWDNLSIFISSTVFCLAAPYVASVLVLYQRGRD